MKLKSQDFQLSFIISLALQSSMDLGLPHNPPPVLSILGLHSPTSDAHPVVLLHICYPVFSWLVWFFPAIDFFIQYLFQLQGSSICFTWLRLVILLDLINLTMSAWPRMDSILWYDLNVHSPFGKQGLLMLLTVLLSKTLKDCSSAVLVVQISAPYVTTDIMSILYSVNLSSFREKVRPNQFSQDKRCTIPPCFYCLY